MVQVHQILKEEEGSALITVLIIALIISLFIGAVLSGIFLQSIFIQKDIDRTKALYKAEQQIYQYLYSGAASDSLGMVLTSTYGGYLLINSSSIKGNEKVELEVLVGEVQDSVFKYAVALKDSNSALNLTGSTIIKGNVALGNDEISTSSFKGFPFSGSFIGETNKKNMEQFFPEFNKTNLESQIVKYESIFKKDLSVFKRNGLTDFKTSQNGDTLYFDGSEVWELSDEFYVPKKSVVIVQGNLHISGSGDLGAFATIIAKDTLSIAGKIKGSHVALNSGKLIEIAGQASMSAQILTKGRVTLSEEAYLTYPSVIYSSKDTYLGEEKEAIHFKDKSIVDGMVIYTNETGVFNENQFRVKVDEGAVIRGALYNLGQTELQGTVMGTVLTRQFYFYESPTSYTNWIKDGEIDVSKRPFNFVTPIGFSDSTKYAILSWQEI